MFARFQHSQVKASRLDRFVRERFVKMPPYEYAIVGCSHGQHIKEHFCKAVNVLYGTVPPQVSREIVPSESILETFRKYF